MAIRFAMMALIINLFCGFSLAAGEHSTTNDAQRLWHATTPPAQPPDQSPKPKEPWVLRQREIVLNAELFQIFKDAAARPHPGIGIELFDGDRYNLDITSTVSRMDDTSIVKGKILPPAVGDFSFVASGNLLVGTIHVGNRLYKTEHIVNGRLRLIEVDPDKLPPD